jgi:hypothetical protein
MMLLPAMVLAVLKILIALNVNVLILIFPFSIII